MTWFGCCTSSSPGGGSGGGGGGSGSGYLVADLIEEARAIVDDDHDEEPGWIKPERWIRWLNWEIQALARRAVQMSLVRPTVTEFSFTGPTTTINGVFTIVGVFDQDGTPLTPAQESHGPEPFHAPHTDGPALHYAAHGRGDNLELELHPRDARTYTVRYIEQPGLASAPTDHVLVPQGFERRLILGMASYALLKEGSASAALNRKIAEADAEIGFTLFGRVDAAGPKARNDRTPRLHGRFLGRFR